MRRKQARLAAIIMLAGLFFFSTKTAAKTIDSAKAESVFFYATNSEGKSVLMKVVPLGDIEAIEHGQLSGISSGKDTGENYYISCTDNYPTTQYCEAKGITVSELLSYIKRVSKVNGADSLTFGGEDAIKLMATDSYGSYTRSWTYSELYGVPRYFFEGLYDACKGWKSGWELGTDSAKFGTNIDAYNSEYKDKDAYYSDKRTVFALGTQTTAILATKSFSGRTASSSLNSSSEAGLADYISANSGKVAGCLKNKLSDDCTLRLCVPMSEADLMTAHRTAYDNFKWIYNIRLDMKNAPNIVSLGKVAEPQVSVSLSADKKILTVTMTCATAGASIYYSFDSAPQTLYTAPVTLDVSGRDLSSNPVTFYMAAVKEGWDDAGMITTKYPGMSPNLQTLYSALIGTNLSFMAAEGVTAQDWTGWVDSITGISMKAPESAGYQTLSTDNYKFDKAAKTLSFSSGLFTDAGSYSFRIQAKGYAAKNISVSMKKKAPTLTAEASYECGMPITLSFSDGGYQKGLNVYISSDGGERTLISPTYLDRSAAGKMTITSTYYSSGSCAVTKAGAYNLELVNTAFSPDTQKITITVEEGSGYSDVSLKSWYGQSVKYVLEAGLFKGTGTGVFSPDGTMTRAMFVTVLSRLAKADTGTVGASDFADVPVSAWYALSVSWANKNGLVGGVTADTFAPDSPITREQLVTILYRFYAYQKKTADASDSSTLEAFSDSGDVSGWAKEAMTWAVGTGLLSGSDGKLNPKGLATRAQVAKIVTSYCSLAAK